jgi:hypothetical protein
MGTLSTALLGCETAWKHSSFKPDNTTQQNSQTHLARRIQRNSWGSNTLFICLLLPFPLFLCCPAKVVVKQKAQCSSTALLHIPEAQGIQLCNFACLNQHHGFLDTHLHTLSESMKECPVVGDSNRGDSWLFSNLAASDVKVLQHHSPCTTHTNRRKLTDTLYGAKFKNHQTL